MKQDQSLLKKNPLWYLECTVLYKRYRSLALNIGLFKKKRKSAKCPLEHIFTVFKVPFLQQEKKKVLQRQEIGLLFVLKLSQKQNEHASRYSFFFSSKFYISSKTYVLEDQTLYIFLKKLTFECDKSQTKINNLYLTNCNGSVTVLLHNARTRALFGFWYLRKKATCLLAKKQNRQLWCVLLYLLKLCFFPLKTATNSQV